MRVAVDTDILGYVEALDDVDRQHRAKAVLARLEPRHVVVPLQVAAELHRLLMRRRGSDSAGAALAVRRWQSKLSIQSDNRCRDGCCSGPRDRTSSPDLRAIILAASAEAGCYLLLSEDMQDGFVWRGVTVVNPLAPTPHPLLADLLRR